MAWKKTLSLPVEVRREMLSPERVDEAFEYDMDEEEVRRLGLTATNEFEVVQKIELRQSPIHVTEHRLRVYLTPDGKRTTASVPEKSRPPLGRPLVRTERLMYSYPWRWSPFGRSHNRLEVIGLNLDIVVEIETIVNILTTYGTFPYIYRAAVGAVLKKSSRGRNCLEQSFLCHFFGMQVTIVIFVADDRKVSCKIFRLGDRRWLG